MKRTSSLRIVSLVFSSVVAKYGIDWLRIALSIVYIWFGALKVLGISPAHDLVELTVFWFNSSVFVPILGTWEVLIGVGLLFRRLISFTIIVLLLHMICTLVPLFVVPNICFDAFPYRPSLVGQYIIKNLVLITGALVVGSKSVSKS
jgi:uncharacterized membrane protein YkgB